MAYGDVKEHFSKGELNDLWNFIEFVGEIFPSKRDNIEKLKNSFIRYALVKPWPLGNDEEPEFFEIKLWAREYADFNYYIGLGAGLKAGAEIADEGKASFDLESAILSACIERTEQKSIAHQAAISEGKRSLIDFLASHVGENPTRNDMRSASKLSFEVIREIIDTLKDNQILDMDAKRFIVSFDSERADALLFPKD